MTTHHFGEVTGADNELLDRLIYLIDQSPDREPLWWSDYGVIAAVNVACGAPAGQDSAARARYISELRYRIAYLIDAGAAEEFLVRALRMEIDDFARARANIGETADKSASFRAHLTRVIKDPAARARWRHGMGNQSPRYADMSDDQIIAVAQDMLDRAPEAMPITAEDVATGWWSSEAWLNGSQELLSDQVITRWRHLSIQRQLNV